MSVLTETLDRPVGECEIRILSIVVTSRVAFSGLILKQLSVPLSVNCDPCDSTELLPQPISAATGATTSTDLQALTLASLPPLSDASCGFRPEEGPTFQDTLVPEQPLDLGQAFMASQMSEINISMVSGVQTAPGGQVSNSMIEG